MRDHQQSVACGGSFQQQVVSQTNNRVKHLIKAAVRVSLGLCSFHINTASPNQSKAPIQRFCGRGLSSDLEWGEVERVGRGSAADQSLWKRKIGCHTHSSRRLFLNPNSVLCPELLQILVRTFREREREMFFVFGCRYTLRGPSCLFVCQTFELNLNSVVATSGSFSL